MNASPRFAYAVAAIACWPFLIGCGGGGGSPSMDGCNVSCGIPYAFATFNLSCSATDLTNVAVSGPCATGDGSPQNYVFEQSIAINSSSPGVCHVELTFATGFTYSTDVTFASQTANPSACCPLYTAPTQSTFNVDNPSTTFVDAGTDAGTDGPSEGASCPQDVPCGCSCPSGDDGGVCVCQNFSMPACPSNASTSGSCNYTGRCMGCSEGVGFTCGCSDAGVPGADGGPNWLCIGTEYACTGGTP